MEKKVAHYNLDSIKELVKNNHYYITGSARTSYTNLGFTDDDVIEIIMSLSSSNLYKSMTSYHSNQIWQDVYHKTVKQTKLYIKLQINEKAIIISFKENEND